MGRSDLLTSQAMKLAAAGVIALVGLFLFIRAYSGGSDSNSGSNDAPTADQLETETNIGAVTEPGRELTPITKLEFDFPFEINPTADALPTIVQKMREEARASASRLEGRDSLNSLQREALAEAASERLRILLLGDHEAWRAHVRSLGGSIDEEPFDDFETTWRGCASRARMSPISLDNLQIRPVIVDGARRDELRTAFVVKPFIRANYPDVDGDRLDVYEVLFPLYYRSAESASPDIKTWCGVEYAWDRDNGRWIPRDMTMYGNGFSGTVRSFVF